LNYHHRYSDPEIVETCLVGTGGFGQSFASQSRFMPLINVRVLVDRDCDKTIALLGHLNVPCRDIAICTSAKEAWTAWLAGQYVVSDDVAHVVDLPFSVLIEATGHPEAGARHARLAVEAGHHVALVSKEVDSVVGAGLAHEANARGVVVTPVDGDQPSLLIGLITWAQILGLDIISAGKSSEYDFVFDAATNILSCNGIGHHCPDMAKLMDAEDRQMADLAAARSAAASAFRQRAVPDLCEMGLVANATGFGFDRPDLHAPIARIPEVPAMFETVDNGGLFSSGKVLDVFHCLRRPDEVSLAGGVFVIVRCHDAGVWDMLAEKGHIVNAQGSAAMLSIPRHLLGLEAATTILDAALLNESSGASIPMQSVELVARATAELPAGHVLEMGGHHHTIENVEADLLDAEPLSGSSPAPFYLAANKRLCRTVAAGAHILMDDLETDENSELCSLRRKHDQTVIKRAEQQEERAMKSRGPAETGHIPAQPMVRQTVAELAYPGGKKDEEVCSDTGGNLERVTCHGRRLSGQNH